MGGTRWRLGVLLVGVVAACDWAPFDPDLLEPSEADPGPGARPDGRADDARQTSSGDDDAAAGDGDSADAGPAADDPGEQGEPLVPSGELEPNDDMRDAQAVGVSDVVLAEWTPAGDEDWFVVSLLEGDLLDIRTHSDDGGCDFDSFLMINAEWADPRPGVTSCQDRDPAAQLCIDDFEGSPCAQVEIEVLADGLYYVRALELGSDDHALYSIDFELQP